MKDKKIYLTKKGIEKVQEEYKKLKLDRQTELGNKSNAPEVLYSEEVNSDDISFQEKMNLIDSQITELEHVIKNMRPIKPAKGVVDIGTVVTVSVNGQNNKITIVESLEADPEMGMISKESTVGKALLGSKKGDEIVVASSNSIYKIKKIEHLSS